MFVDAKTPRDYLDNLEDDWRRQTLLSIRKEILDQTPKLEETIHYRMLAYGIGDDHVFHLNVQRAYVSLYVGDICKIDPNGELLTGLSTGKGCIRFKKTNKVASTRIDEFVARGVDMWRDGTDLGC